MYKIIGANKVEYGPVSVDQLRQWITEGRINADTLAQAVGETGWKPIASYADFAANFPSPSTPPPLSSSPPPFATGTPQPLSPGIPGGREQALDAVSGPAVGLMVVGGLGVAFGLFRILAGLIGMTFGKFNNWESMNIPRQNMEVFHSIQNVSGVLGTGFAIVTIALSILILYAGVKMKRLESQGLCTVACVIAMIPCISPCCLVGLPIGIWALVVMNKAEVRDYFS